ncbi:MAG TPA: hypothetical protein VME19_05170 [Streptosporangiaceae bacterium]|nr:hypothetical protein [Streptosporangiaceae bacterium]
MSKGTVILLIWLVIGAAAAGQRGDFGGQLDCSQGATIALTIISGPLNYLGLDPTISCATPEPPKPST